jgi:hypothetical protein
MIDVNARRTREILRALLRFHFSEWDYNGHIGGEDIERLLGRPNPIIEHSNECGVEEICLIAYESGYETADLGVSLFSGYDDGFRLTPLEALSKGEDPFLAEIRRRLQTENHFHVAKEVERRLKLLRRHIDKELHSGTYLRARIGVRQRAVRLGTRQQVYVPYSCESLMAPPPPLAVSGRINRAGVSFLYAASDVSTAIAEVRPHPGHRVSTGGLRQTGVCRIADLTEVRLVDFAHSDSALDEFLFLRTIERDLATPVVPEERTRYLLGQVVADVLREMGFHGIAYRSSVAGGTNFCFFEPKAFEYIDGSATVVLVTGLQYDTAIVDSIRGLTSEYLAL